MAYEEGSYLKELTQAHHEGEHAEDDDLNCPVCYPEDDLYGFSSQEEFEKATWEGAHALEDALEAHKRGEHKTRPALTCTHRVCMNRLEDEG